MPNSNDKITNVVYVKNNHGIIYGRKCYTTSGELVSADFFMPFKKRISCRNELGQITDYIEVDYSTVKQHTTYKYDEKCRLVEQCKCDEKGLILDVTKRIYKNETDYYEYYTNPSNGYSHKAFKMFDENKKKIGQTEFNNNVPSFEKIYSYTIDGQLEKVQWFKITSKQKKEFYGEEIRTYRNGNLINSSYYSKNKLLHEHIFTYDMQNKMLSHTDLDYTSDNFTPIKLNDELIDNNPNIKWKALFQYETPFRYTKYASMKCSSNAKDDHSIVEKQVCLCELYENTRLLKVEYYYDDEGIIVYKDEYQYDEFGKEILMQAFGFQGNYLNLTQYYDEYDILRVLDGEDI